MPILVDPLDPSAAAAAGSGHPTFHPCGKVCPTRCESVFDRVVVSYRISQGSMVMWELLDTFIDAKPYLFQLQVGTTANNDADDWADVGGPVEDQFFAVDAEQRVRGKLNWTHYRVLLTTGNGTYVSTPVDARGTLNKRDWLMVRNTHRFEAVRMRQMAGQEGYLLKRRVTGQACRVCTDPMTFESRNPFCPSCYGTGRECGYYYPIGCTWTDMPAPASHVQRDGQQRGTVDDERVATARMLVTELLIEEDVWVSKVTDDRYYVHSVRPTASLRGVPIVADVGLRLIPYSSPIYALTIPQQLAALLDAEVSA